MNTLKDSFLESYYLEQLKEIKQIALVRLKTALVDPRAMFTDLTAIEIDTIVSRCTRLFKYLISLDKGKLDMWFQAPSSLEIDANNASNLEQLAEYVLERFKEENKNNLNFATEFGLNESEVIGSIMCRIRQTNNSDNMDFSFFCNHLHLDEATYNMVKKTLVSKSTNDSEIWERIQESMCSGVDLLVLLTMANAEASGWPLSLNWMLVDVQENEITVEDLISFEEMLYSEVQEILAEPEGPTTAECETIIRQFEQTVKDIGEKLGEAQIMVKKLENTDLLEMIEEHVGVIAERRQNIKNHIPESIREHKIYSDIEVVEASNELKNIREETAFLRNASLAGPPKNVKTLAQKLDLQRTQTCLARRNNSLYFCPARIVNKQNANVYTVEFLDLGDYSSLDVSDIANTEVPLFDPSFGQGVNRFIGLRVAACVEIKGKGQKWMAGTVGAVFGSHGDDFLVFFDKHMDRYIAPVFQPEHRSAREYRELEHEKPITNKELCDWVSRRTNALKMFPLCEQSFTSNGTEIYRASVYELVNESDEIKTFLHRYFDKFPDWPLVRMRKSSPGTIPQRITMADKRVAFVIEVFKAMCVVRYPKENEPGDDCFVYNCGLDHNHEDEWLYRGSTLINTMNLDETNNTNLSTRQKNRNRRYYDEETKKNTARKTGIPSQNYSYCPPPSTINKEQLNERKKKANKFKIVSLKCEVPKRNIPAHPVCNKQCLGDLDRNPYDLSFKGISPFAIPLMCGWKRNRYELSGNKPVDKAKTRNTLKYIIYIAPCGKVLRNMAAVGTFLRTSDSQLTIDLFTDNVYIDPLQVVEVEKSAIILEDYTKGQEFFPIPAVNSLDDEAPPDVLYGARKFPLDERVNISTINENFCSGCSCEDDCSDPRKCECLRLTTESVNRLTYTSRPKEYGYKYRKLHGRTITGIYECNPNCSCNIKKCWNRVVQQEIKFPLQLFKTGGCGWGVRAVCDIPKGSFIANYVGALMTDEIAENKGTNDDQYFADLDLNDVVENEKIVAQRRYGHLNLYPSEQYEYEYQAVPDEDEDDAMEGCPPPRKVSKRNSQEEANGRKNRKILKQREAEYEEQRPIFKWSDYFGETEQLFVLDAKYKGNIGRFLNHSCDPNVRVQHVLVDTHDLRLPWSSFFSTRDIKAGEELCWNYNYRLDDDRPIELQISCYCGAKLCGGRLL